ncbi:MAG: hypothetical protein GY845_22760 [Planctomycetes bacterium]|nr:hypothetical protein [Planctomycetota bacterium]
MKYVKLLLTCLIAVGLFCQGCKKESSPQEAQVAQTPDQVAKEKEFVSNSEVVTAKLENTTISKLDILEHEWPSFIRRMERKNKKDLKQAELTIADKHFKILMGKDHDSEFHLYEDKSGYAPYWWGSWSMNSFHKIDDEYFEFMLVENGSKIACRPYKGELGVIKIGKGGRDLEKAEFRGSVFQSGYVSAPIGKIEERLTSTVDECKIPTGDYTAYMINVTYDNLSISFSNNYHTDAQGIDISYDVVYGIHICKDKPYVLDFSNKPMVVFTFPPVNNASFSRGEEIEFAAVLIDPELDLMMRRLYDTSVQVEQETSSGHKFKRSKSLDPKVVITRGDGEVVAEGVMPFG